MSWSKWFIRKRRNDIISHELFNWILFRLILSIYEYSKSEIVISYLCWYFYIIVDMLSPITRVVKKSYGGVSQCSHGWNFGNTIGVPNVLGGPPLEGPPVLGGLQTFLGANFGGASKLQ